VSGFDPRSERLLVHLIRVKMLGLSLKFWTIEIFKAIGDNLGTFLGLEEYFKVDTSCSISPILVDLD